jgi:hypothetical protein
MQLEVTPSFTPLSHSSWGESATASPQYDARVQSQLQPP